jgi:hypothetical protein
MSKKADQDFVSANLAEVESLLKRMTSKDALTSMSLASLRDEWEEELAILHLPEGPEEQEVVKP